MHSKPSFFTKIHLIHKIRNPLRLISILVLCISGCTSVGPDYVPPETTVQASWHTKLEGGLSDESMSPQSLSEWWKTLNDSVLSSLTERAISSNLDLKKALSKIRESRARRGIANADFFPSLSTSGSITWSRVSEDTGSGRTNDIYASSTDAGWELDIFGGVRRSVEAADANVQASLEDLRDVLVSLLAELALNYIDVRTYQARIAIAQSNLDSQSETYSLISWRCQAGLSDELSLQQARYNLESTRSQIPSLRKGLEEAMNRIAVLLGEQPGKVHEELTKSMPIPVTPLKVAIGVPADLLRRRPDIRRAERELAVQTAKIGVEKAELYPKFTLNGSIGLEALSLANLPASGSWTITGGPKISWAIFKAGSILQSVEAQTAVQEQYLIQYRSTILAAMEEVENAMVAYAEEQKKRVILRDASQAAKTAAELARQKYEAGLSDFGDVLDAQRSLLSFQDQLAQSEGNITSCLVRLYKVLGGGWHSFGAEQNSSIQNTVQVQNTVHVPNTPNDAQVSNIAQFQNTAEEMEKEK